MKDSIKIKGLDWEILDWMETEEHIFILTGTLEVVSLILDRYPITLPNSNVLCNRLGAKITVWKNYKLEWEVWIEK